MNVEQDRIITSFANVVIVKCRYIGQCRHRKPKDDDNSMSKTICSLQLPLSWRNVA